ncbi:MAG: hypothetical protein HY898_27680 [Deltaproteobacteria bacterium]|nr:hypothetical protein [Deltaproteobacteria bacterium]
MGFAIVLVLVLVLVLALALVLVPVLALAPGGAMCQEVIPPCPVGSPRLAGQGCEVPQLAALARAAAAARQDRRNKHACMLLRHPTPVQRKEGAGERAEDAHRS